MNNKQLTSHSIQSCSDIFDMNKDLGIDCQTLLFCLFQYFRALDLEHASVGGGVVYKRLDIVVKWLTFTQFCSFSLGLGYIP